MIAFALGLGVLALLLWAARGFATAPVGTVKAFLLWVGVLGGLSLTALLLMTGRGPMAFTALLLVGPSLWSRWRDRAGPGRTPAQPGARMGRAEALQVLGLSAGASEADIRAAWVRLMRAAHPDNGGSDWLASRVNQARDVLLRK